MAYKTKKQKIEEQVQTEDENIQSEILTEVSSHLDVVQEERSPESPDVSNVITEVTPEVFKGRIVTNFPQVVEFMQENKIKYTVPKDNPLFFFVQEGKYVSLKEATVLLKNRFGNHI